MLVPSKNTPDKDNVYTPKELAKAIIGRLLPVGASYLDPCRGDGSFLYSVNPENNITFSLELDDGDDFISNGIGHVDWIITNPPWSKFRDFLIRGMEDADNIAYLAPINHFITKARLRDIQERGFYINEFILVDTPKEFPQSGFQLVVGVLSKIKSDTKWSKLRKLTT